MLFLPVLSACLLPLASSFQVIDTLDSNIPADHYLWGPDGVRTQTLEKRSCTNGPLTRACWAGNYNVSTDFDQSWPTTGVTRSYTLSVTNTTCNPDGHGSRICLLFNNQYPGPTITANWGDMISITVQNKLQNNGTSIHWHGIRQLKSVGMDGVAGITECPIAPGQSKTYTFQATQYGTSWYHSHYSAQYGDGLVGAIQINGPASANYDYDLGPFPVTDWFYSTSFQVDLAANANLQRAQPPPPANNILIQGTNQDGNNHGTYSITQVVPGAKSRFRLINTSVDNAIRVSIDSHTMTVITSDFVPIVPITTDSVLLAIGQRYDVIITANQTGGNGNFWMRATVETACASANNGAGFAIINYAGFPILTPTTASTAVDNGCNPPGALVPYVSNQVGSSSAFIQQARSLDVNLEIPGVTTNQGNIVTWGINMTAMQVQWNDPTLSYVMTGNTTYPVTENLITIPNEGVWTYWIIQETSGADTPVPIPHPIHLHGHDFYVLGSGSGVFDTTNDPPTLQYNNPTRRDTTFLPGGGWLALAFPADNPGAWLMHCHIAWHISEGLGVQFLESPGSIALPASAQYNAQCGAWETYYQGAVYRQVDSGL